MSKTHQRFYSVNPTPKYVTLGGRNVLRSSVQTVKRDSQPSSLTTDWNYNPLDYADFDSFQVCNNSIFMPVQMSQDPNANKLQIDGSAKELMAQDHVFKGYNLNNSTHYMNVVNEMAQNMGLGANPKPAQVKE